MSEMLRPDDWEDPVVIPDLPAMARILVPFDGSHTAERALAWAELLAGASGAEIVVMVAYQPPLTKKGRGATYVEAMRDEMQAESESLANEAVELVRSRGGASRGIVVRGELLVGLQGRQWVPTERHPPGEAARTLSRTLGIPIFQEQVMEISMVAAGFTGAEADGLRRALSGYALDALADRVALVQAARQKRVALPAGFGTVAQMLADDAGLCVDAFGGEPGVDTAYYATRFGYPKGDATNVRALLEALAQFGFASVGLSEADFLKPDAVVQLGYPPARIDLMTAIDGVGFVDAAGFQERDVWAHHAGDQCDQGGDAAADVSWCERGWGGFCGDDERES